MSSISESKKNHLWRKIVWQTDPEEHPLGPWHVAEVYCCEESNGYAVWYVRKLSRDDAMGIPGTDNADYLLNYYGRNGRDEAIERAVLVANADADPARTIEALDRLAQSAQRT
ncbi:hypothetical protein [Noviherbaspirillum galbum]|uniref:Uncharacterized protein n=1 Tax=Noviherbaspirillum galbum TaxID=2709383 RepID=A0A6B3SNF5_9BURK|nr:hypothetical protein [Noviherbaspirillum galbum]NEX60286.1 hypothetical protein [Noviherbaspirillum galbum]